MHLHCLRRSTSRRVSNHRGSVGTNFVFSTGGAGSGEAACGQLPRAALNAPPEVCVRIVAKRFAHSCVPRRTFFRARRKNVQPPFCPRSAHRGTRGRACTLCTFCALFWAASLYPSGASAAPGSRDQSQAYPSSLSPFPSSPCLNLQKNMTNVQKVQPRPLAAL